MTLGMRHKVAVFAIAICFLSGCAASTAYSTYKSKYFGVSFKYPRYLQVMSYGVVKKIASESLLLYKDFPNQGIHLTMIDINEIEDLFSNDFIENYRKYVKYGSGERVIVIQENSIAIFFNQFFISIDYTDPFTPSNAIKTLPCKDIAMEIAKSVEFAKQKINKTVINQSNENVENIISLIVQKTTLYYNGYIDRRSVAERTEEIMNDPVFREKYLPQMMEDAKQEVENDVKKYNESQKKAIKRP